MILTLPPEALLQLQFVGTSSAEYRSFLERLKSVQPVRETKIFLIYSHPWWRTNELSWTWLSTDTSIKQIVDLGTLNNINHTANQNITSISILMLILDNINYYSYWQAFDIEKSQVSAELSQIIHHQLARIFHINIALSDILLLAVKPTWDYSLHGSSHYVWKNNREVSLQDIILPSMHKHLHIIGDAFLDFQKQLFPLENILDIVDSLIRKFPDWT